MDRVLRVLVVDDSAYVRKVIKQMLSRSPFIEVVGAARDGQEALEMVEQLAPDVVTCDLIMPVLDGVGFVREQMSRRARPHRHRQHSQRRQRACAHGPGRRRGRFCAKAYGACDRKDI